MRWGAPRATDARVVSVMTVQPPIVLITAMACRDVRGGPRIVKGTLQIVSDRIQMNVFMNKGTPTVVLIAETVHENETCIRL